LSTKSLCGLVVFDIFLVFFDHFSSWSTCNIGNVKEYHL